MFMVSGGLEDGAPTVGQYEQDQLAMVDTLQAAGFTIGEDAEVVAYIRDDGRHTESFWRREFPEVVRWLFADR
jgi:hypothetical protein